MKLQLLHRLSWGRQQKADPSSGQRLLKADANWERKPDHAIQRIGFIPLILALAGGVGGAKLIKGLASICSPDELMIGVNVGDDFVHMGLHISPDLDSVMYKLAGLNDRERGWGLANETWHFMENLKRLGGPSWFNLGDQDLATHIQRTSLLKAGNSLSMVTNQLSQALGIAHQISPISNFRISTFVKSALGEIPFQDYFCKIAMRARGIRFQIRGGRRRQFIALHRTRPFKLSAQSDNNMSLESFRIDPADVSNI